MLECNLCCSGLFLFHQSYLLPTTHPHTHTYTHTHTPRGSVLSVAVGASGDICFSGSTDTTIRVWQLPSDLGDPFDVYGKIIWFFHVLCAFVAN